jgi:hypothetical protein
MDSGEETRCIGEGADRILQRDILGDNFPGFAGFEESARNQEDQEKAGKRTEPERLPKAGIRDRNSSKQGCRYVVQKVSSADGSLGLGGSLEKFAVFEWGAA